MKNFLGKLSMSLMFMLMYIKLFAEPTQGLMPERSGET